MLIRLSFLKFLSLYVWRLVFSIFFFKQKTAYEMLISDWSSDVCSSDLRAASHLLRDAGQFLLRRLLQGRSDPAGLEPDHQGIWPAQGQALGHRDRKSVV